MGSGLGFHAAFMFGPWFRGKEPLHSPVDGEHPHVKVMFIPELHEPLTGLQGW